MPGSYRAHESFLIFLFKIRRRDERKLCCCLTCMIFDCTAFRRRSRSSMRSCNNFSCPLFITQLVSRKLTTPGFLYSGQNHHSCQEFYAISRCSSVNKSLQELEVRIFPKPCCLKHYAQFFV